MKRILIASLLTAFSIGLFAAPELEKSFVNPSDSAKPRTYWFHMSGNISKPGITADLEAMQEIGLGGTLFMNVSVAMPTGLVERKDFMSPAWQDCFQHMLNESARLNLDFGSAVCDGWGNAGGPDIPPQLAMQRLTWNETRVRGGETVELAKLPQPVTELDTYRDIAVVAFPTPPGDQATSVLPAVETFSAKGSDSNFPDDFAAPVTVSELTLTGAATGFIEASDDGTTWREVKKFPATGWRGYMPTGFTVAFNPTTARHFRVQVKGLAKKAKVAEATLSARKRIHYWQAKSATTFHNEHGGGAEYFLDAGAADAPGIPLASVVNLTGKDKWVAPAGDWTVLRVG
ncbi:MAG: glycosyl hydrolase, partial [Verrucomicrobia bacterium]|nr:glycosyl hydrolase [Verrucomicrobiota bacterium]